MDNHKTMNTQNLIVSRNDEFKKKLKDGNCIFFSNSAKIHSYGDGRVAKAGT